MSKASKNQKAPTGYRIYSQYILVGGAIGLYYGIFSRGTQDAPDYGMAVILAVLAGLITAVVRNWRKKKPFMTVALDAVKISALFLVFLLALQTRSVIEGWGGRTAVIVVMTVLGVALGLILGVTRKPARP